MAIIGVYHAMISINCLLLPDTSGDARACITRRFYSGSWPRSVFVIYLPEKTTPPTGSGSPP